MHAEFVMTEDVTFENVALCISLATFFHFGLCLVSHIVHFSTSLSASVVAFALTRFLCSPHNKTHVI